MCPYFNSLQICKNLLQWMINQSLKILSGISTSFLYTRVCVYVCVLVTQSCLTLCNLMDCRPPGSSVHGILQANILEWGSHALLQGIFLTQGLNPGLLHCRHIFYHLNHKEPSSIRLNSNIFFIWGTEPHPITPWWIILAFPLGFHRLAHKTMETHHDAFVSTTHMNIFSNTLWT